jgi:hypothetical protein
MNASPDSLRERELDVAREIANAFLTLVRRSRCTAWRWRADAAGARQLQLRLRARPADPTLLKLTCANNWPQSSARYLVSSGCGSAAVRRAARWREASRSR